MRIKILQILVILTLILVGLVLMIPSRTTYIQNYIVIFAEITMYNSLPSQTDETPTITANGEKATHGTIACPVRLPFGTIVEVNGKRYICNDRMGKRYRNTNHFDIWVPDRQTAILHGRQKMEVKVFNTNQIVYANRP